MHRRTLHELELLLLKLLFVTSLKHTAFGLNIKPEYWNIVLFVCGNFNYILACSNASFRVGIRKYPDRYDRRGSYRRSRSRSISRSPRSRSRSRSISPVRRASRRKGSSSSDDRLNLQNKSLKSRVGKRTNKKGKPLLDRQFQVENDTTTAKKKQDRAARFQSVVGKKQRIDSVRNISVKLFHCNLLWF